MTEAYAISYVRGATKEEIMSTFGYSVPDGVEWDENEQAWKVTFYLLANSDAWYDESDDDARGSLPNARFKQVCLNEDGTISWQIDYMNYEEYEKWIKEEVRKWKNE